MLKVLKNLKKSFWKVLCIVILLCIQAAADLKLPDYTSKIVNTGIQSNGIQTAIPEIISKQDMENLLLFTNNDNEILNNYSLVGNNTTKEENKLLEKYLGKNNNVKAETIYVLKDIDKNEITEFEDMISTPLMIVSTIENEEIANKIKEQIARKFTRKPETIYLFSKINRYNKIYARRTKKYTSFGIHKTD